MTTASRLMVMGKPATVGAAFTTSQLRKVAAPLARPALAWASTWSLADSAMTGAPSTSFRAERGSMPSQPGMFTWKTVEKKLRA